MLAWILEAITYPKGGHRLRPMLDLIADSTGADLVFLCNVSTSQDISCTMVSSKVFLGAEIVPKTRAETCFIATGADLS
jgi:hypothetical protein